tara:strand:- start:2926 stop:3408 length:483 start_codon:yes stop_codon:yes gene_type:complete
MSLSFKSDIKTIVEETLYRLGCYSDDALVMVLRTGQAESGYRVLQQNGGGPALSYWQVEPATAKDCVDNYLKYRETRYNALLSLGYTPNNIEYSLLSNISVGAAFCRIKYLRDRKPIPSWDDVEAQAAYWKRVYNTELGKGTIEHFIKANDGYFESLPSQ